MKSATSLLLSVFTLVFLLTGCFDSTGQENDYYEPDVAQDETVDRKRSKRDRNDDEWAEHRKNFGDQRTTSSRSSSDSDWGSDNDHNSDWDSEEFDRSMQELKEELDGLVDLNQLEDKLKSIERDFENRENGEGFEDLERAMESLGEAFSEMGTAISNGVDVESVDYDELKDILPDRIRGYKKKNFNGDKVSVFGLNLSVLEQEYESERGDGYLDVTVIDLGSLANAAVAGLDWLDLDIQSESSTGFEKTTTIDGYPAFEECERSYGKESCSLHLVVEDRFVVQIESDDMGMKDIRGVLDDMDVRKLAQLN